jgi:hypothetical protein
MLEELNMLRAKLEGMEYVKGEVHLVYQVLYEIIVRFYFNLVLQLMASACIPICCSATTCITVYMPRNLPLPQEMSSCISLSKSLMPASAPIPIVYVRCEAKPNVPVQRMAAQRRAFSKYLCSVQTDKSLLSFFKEAC